MFREVQPLIMGRSYPYQITVPMIRKSSLSPPGKIPTTPPRNKLVTSNCLLFPPLPCHLVWDSGEGQAPCARRFSSVLPALVTGENDASLNKERTHRRSRFLFAYEQFLALIKDSNLIESTTTYLVGVKRARTPFVVRKVPDTLYPQYLYGFPQ